MPTTVPDLEAHVLRALQALPEPVIQRIAGRPIERDGMRLAPESHLLLTLQRLVRDRPVNLLSLASARRTVDRHAGLVSRDQRVGAVTDLTVAERPARLYTPMSQLRATSIPTMLYFHGGYHTFGSLRSHDGALRHLAEHSGVQVLSLDYRLAPEHPFPAGLDDGVAALRWLTAHPDAVRADPARIAVGGDSAGGNLAAATVQQIADEIALAFQLLVYPVTDFTRVSPSRETLGTGFYLTQAAMSQAAERYLPDAEQRADPRASVALGTIAAGTPRTLVITAGFDPLRDEGNDYAEKLRAAGVEVEHEQYDDMLHGFFNQVTIGRRAGAYNRDIAAKVGRALRQPS